MFKSSTRKFVASASMAFALVAVGLLSLTPSITLAAQGYNFSSSTAEIGALQTDLAGVSMTIVFGAIAAFIVIALALMGAGYVWGKFKKFTGIKKKL